MDITDIREKISPVLRAHGIKEAKIFGSVSRGEDRPDSDVDLVVSLGKPMGMFAYMRLLNQLEAVLGKKVDLLTEKSINKFIRPHILEDLKVVYEG